MEDGGMTFAYLKDTEAKECYPLTTASLYPQKISIDDTYAPEELTFAYDSETECPYATD